MSIEPEIRRRRTFAIISHPDAGKTTVTEKLLFHGNAIQLAGEVKARKSARHATSDWMAIEKERGISVTTAVMQFIYKDLLINLLDTPGHADFSEDTYRTLTAVDAALMVIDGSKGVEPRTIKLMEICRQRRLPVWAFINKIDRDIRDPMDLLDEIEDILHLDCTPMNWPLGMGRYLHGLYQLHEDRVHVHAGRNRPQPVMSGFASPEVRALLEDEWQEYHDSIELLRGAGHGFSRQAFLAGDLAPVSFGSALMNFGVREMFDSFVTHAPSPGARDTIGSRRVAPAEPEFSGFVFKIQANMDARHRDRIAFMRVCSGRYQTGMKMTHVRTGKTVKTANAITFMAADRRHTPTAYAGDIIGLRDRDSIRIGDTYTQGEKLKFAGIPNFAPELFRRIQLRDPWKSKQLERGLRELTEEGATQFFRPLENNDLILGAVGQLQFDVVIYRLNEEYKVACDYVPYSLHTVRWIQCQEHRILEKFMRKAAANIALDGADYPVYMAPSSVNLQLTRERWPEVVFQDTREN